MKLGPSYARSTKTCFRATVTFSWSFRLFAFRFLKCDSFPSNVTRFPIFMLVIFPFVFLKRSLSLVHFLLRHRLQRLDHFLDGFHMWRPRWSIETNWSCDVLHRQWFDGNELGRVPSRHSAIELPVCVIPRPPHVP